MDLPVFVSVFSKFFFILTPFFVIAVFLTITDEENTGECQMIFRRNCS